MKDWFESTPDDKEYKYKFLVYPNITYSQDLERDSYILVLVNVIKVLNSIRDDIHFTVLIPHQITSLSKFPNVDQLEYPLPTYPNTMRTHFDADLFLKLVDWKNNDYDVVYSHLPEHTAQISNVLNNSTNINPYIVGYCHWYEIDENTSYAKRMFLANIAGTLEMHECGVNSKWLKEFVIDKAEKYFSHKVLQKLNHIIQPHYLGVDSIFDGESKVIPRSIIFNHRPNEYTGFDWFIKTLDALYETRQDFKLYTTLADAQRPYAEKVNTDTRKEYLEFLRKMSVGVATFENYSAWSISTTDGLSQGVPYLVPSKLCYPEMVPHNYLLYYNGREEFKKKLELALDEPKILKTSKESIQSFIPNMIWGNAVYEWFDNWKFLTHLPAVQRTESYEKIVAFIKNRGNVSKNDILEHMGWGVRIGFSNYRNLLRKEPGIKFTKTRYTYL